MRWNPDLLGVVAPFVDLADVGRFAVASRDVDTALRQPDERAAVLAHLGTAEVRAAASLEHAALAEATRAWRPVGANRRRHNIVIDNDAREVNARCAEVASLLRRHPRAPCRVAAHVCACAREYAYTRAIIFCMCHWQLHGASVLMHAMRSDTEKKDDIVKLLIKSGA